MRDRRTLARIRGIVIPPAWTDVWICRDPKGHLQASGRDARGRKQYRYHPSWRDVRDAGKYGRMLEFGRALPSIRKRVSRDLRRRGLDRNRVLATVVRLMDLTFLRVGNEEYARSNNSHGLTTLRDRHAALVGSRIRLRFRGKGGKRFDVSVADPQLARIVRRCRDIPGQDLFQYYDEGGQARPITSSDVNSYLREISGGDFTARDFRTWAGTALALALLQQCEAPDGERATKSTVLRAIEQVAEKLGNTVAVCRKCYIHPLVIDGFAAGLLPPRRQSAAPPAIATGRRPRSGLASEERDLVAFLRRNRRKVISASA